MQSSFNTLNIKIYNLKVYEFYEKLKINFSIKISGFLINGVLRYYDLF